MKMQHIFKYLNIFSIKLLMCAYYMLIKLRLKFVDQMLVQWLLQAVGYLSYQQKYEYCLW